MWELPGADEQCRTYASGHQVHWIQFNQSMRNPGDVIPVTVTVDADGLVHLEGDDVSFVGWNHEPDRIRAALAGFDGRAEWKPRWHLLLVPMESFFGSARTVFDLAKADDWLPCHVYDSSDPRPCGCSPGSFARRTHIQELWAEQEAKNVELKSIDYSHIPPLRVADRYRRGRSRRPRASLMDMRPRDGQADEG
ncbi:hypothetical protein AU193_15900 [Mycobacterium sp. GA-1285]|nr:hypothetical protein AU193_15900 [Mycobacterium sp. GA-1285]